VGEIGGLPPPFLLSWGSTKLPSRVLYKTSFVQPSLLHSILRFIFRGSSTQGQEGWLGARYRIETNSLEKGRWKGDIAARTRFAHGYGWRRSGSGGAIVTLSGRAACDTEITNQLRRNLRH
jgi:hypothetical protein